MSENPVVAVEPIEFNGLTIVVGIKAALVINTIERNRDCKFHEFFASKMIKLLGWGFSRIKIDVSMEIDEHVIRIIKNGEISSETKLYPELCLAIKSDAFEVSSIGIDAVNIFQGYHGFWIESLAIYKAVKAGYLVLTAYDVLFKWLQRFTISNSDELFTSVELGQVWQLSIWHQSAIKQAIKDIPEEVVIETMRNLVGEEVPLIPIEDVITCFSESKLKSSDPEILIRKIRRVLAPKICSRYVNEENCLNVISLEPQLSECLESNLKEQEGLVLESFTQEKLFLSLLSETKKAIMLGRQPVVLTVDNLRLEIKKLIHKAMPEVPVLSYSEIPLEILLRSVGWVRITYNCQ